MIERVASKKANLAKLGFGALAMAVVALPVAGALAQEEAAAGGELTAEQVAEGRQLFTDWACGACHVLGDANANGQVGPAMDGNSQMNLDFVIGRVTNGQGAMPGFGGQMTDEEIDLMARYILQVKK